jgi:hypothetical protein
MRTGRGIVEALGTLVKKRRTRTALCWRSRHR